MLEESLIQVKNLEKAVDTILERIDKLHMDLIDDYLELQKIKAEMKRILKP